MSVSRRLVLSAGATIVLAAPAFAEPKVAISGYDTVAYFTEGKPVKGDPAFSQIWDGQRFLFSTDKHRELFAANPDKFAPQFAGNCAAGLASGYKVEADPTHFLISDGRLYLFQGDRGTEKMKTDSQLPSRADATWRKLK
jgi:YHS domain-containing protein